jgi:hypothetical protein
MASALAGTCFGSGTGSTFTGSGLTSAFTGSGLTSAFTGSCFGMAASASTFSGTRVGTGLGSGFSWDGCKMLGFKMGFWTGGTGGFTCGFGAGAFSCGRSAGIFWAWGLGTGAFPAGMAGFSGAFSGAFEGFAGCALSAGFSCVLAACSCLVRSALLSLFSRIDWSVSSSFFILSSSSCDFFALTSSFLGFLSNKPISNPNLYFFALEVIDYIQKSIDIYFVLFPVTLLSLN